MIKRYNIFGQEGLRAADFDADRFTFSNLSEPQPEYPKLIPGFVDIHTHGAFGIDFMSASVSEMAELCVRLAEVGYEAFLPTTVTASCSDVERALSVIPQHPMVIGFHLEGPFVSEAYPGAQPKDKIIDPPLGPSEWDPILNDARLRVVTMAPERPGASALIERLAARGVRVSLGHTNATFEQCADAFAAGARHTTHTYNAMRPLHHREPGTVGFAMTQDQVFCELIYDRKHVSRPAAEVLVRCKPKDRLIAISDSTMAAGLPPGFAFKMWGLECITGEGEVRLVDGTLAGSAITLRDACRNLAADFGWDVAVRACCLNPRIALGLDPSRPQVYLEVDDQVNILRRFEREPR